MDGGLEAGGEGPGGGEPCAGPDVVLEGELDGVGLGGAGRRRRVCGSAAGGGDYGRRRGGAGRGGGGPDAALELVVVVEEQLVRLEGGEGERVGEEEEEGEEQEEGAARHGHGWLSKKWLRLWERSAGRKR